MLVEGIRYVDFTDRKTNKQVKGVSIYVSSPIVKNGEGKSFDKFFFNEWFIEHILGGVIPAIGDDVEPRYDKRGSIVDLLIKTPAE